LAAADDGELLQATEIEKQASCQLTAEQLGSDGGGRPLLEAGNRRRGRSGGGSDGGGRLPVEAGFRRRGRSNGDGGGSSPPRPPLSAGGRFWRREIAAAAEAAAIKARSRVNECTAEQMWNESKGSYLEQLASELQACSAFATDTAAAEAAAIKARSRMNECTAEQAWNESKWYYVDGTYTDTEWGPFDTLTMQVWHTQGVIDDATMVRRRDWTTHRPAKGVFEKLTAEQLASELHAWQQFAPDAATEQMTSEEQLAGDGSSDAATEQMASDEQLANGKGNPGGDFNAEETSMEQHINPGGDFNWRLRALVSQADADHADHDHCEVCDNPFHPRIRPRSNSNPAWCLQCLGDSWAGCSSGDSDDDMDDGKGKDDAKGMASQAVGGRAEDELAFFATELNRALSGPAMAAYISEKTGDAYVYVGTPEPLSFGGRSSQAEIDVVEATEKATKAAMKAAMKAMKAPHSTSSAMA